MNGLVQRLAAAAGDHPVFLGALGLAPLAAAAATLLSALLIGVTAAAVFVCTSLTVSTLRRFIPHPYRLAYILVISATWVTAADLLLQFYLYELRQTLDFYVPLIAMNSLLLMLLEDGALRRPAGAGAAHALKTSAAVILVLVPAGGLREILARGGLFTDAYLVVPGWQESGLRVFPPEAGMALFDAAPGALLVLGCLLALCNLLSGSAGRRGGGPDSPA